METHEGFDDTIEEPRMTEQRMKTEPPIGASSRIETGLAGDGSLRWVAVDLGGVLEEARRRLDLSPLAAVALGRALTAAVLVQRIALKVPSRVTVEVMGDGPLGKVIAESESSGGVRGMVGSPQIPNPPGGEMKIAPYVGRGLLRVTREGERNRYSSQVELVTGELGDDLTHYLEQSEQIRSAVLLGVLPKPLGIAAAGGIVIEALPGTDSGVIDDLEGNIRQLEGISAELELGGALRLAQRVLAGLEPERIDSLPVAYHCRCSRDSLLSKLQPLAESEGQTLLNVGRACEAVCAFCGETYRFSALELGLSA